MPFINSDPLNYPANAYDPVRRFRTTRAPTNADYKNFKVGDEWLDDASNDWYILCYRDNTQGIWRKMAGTGGAAEEFLPDAGTTPVVPNALNQVTFTGGANITTVGGLNTVTWNVSGTTDHSLQLGNATGSLNSLGVATDGQLPIGSTGADPVLATLASADGSITITNGPGSIDLSSLGTSMLDEVQIYYVGKHGNDAWTGLNIDEAVLTFGQAITLATAAVPSAVNPIIIKCFDDGIYTENITLIPYLSIDAQNAEIVGNLIGDDNSFVKFKKLTSTGLAVITKPINPGTFCCEIESIECTGNSIIVFNGQGNLHLKCKCLFIENGIALTSNAVSYTDINIDNIYVSGTGIILTYSGGAILNGNIGNIEETGVGIGTLSNNLGATININTNTAVLTNGITATGGTTNFQIEELTTTVAYNIAAGATLNLYVNTLTGTETAAAGSIVNVYKLDTGIATNQTFTIENPETVAEHLSIIPAGDITFNNAYTFPITDGAASDVLVTDGAGNVDWQPMSTFLPNQQQIIYVGKHGNDANSGLNINIAKLTIGAAITAAAAIAPAVVVVLDAGTYTENPTFVSNVNLWAPNATVVGLITVVDGTFIKIKTVNNTNINAITKTAGTGIAYIDVGTITITAAGGAISCSSGTMNVTAQSLSTVSGACISWAGASTSEFYINVGLMTVTGASSALLHQSAGKIIGHVGNISAAGGTAIGIISTGKADLLINKIEAVMGILISAAGIANIKVNDIVCTNAYNISATGTLNLSVNSLTGTETVAPTSILNIWHQTGTSLQHGDATFSSSTAGVARTLTVTNDDNTSGTSNAVLDIITGGASGGDPYIHFDNGVIECSLGLDNSAGDVIKLTTGASPSAGTDMIVIDSIAPASMQINMDQIKHVYNINNYVYYELDNDSNGAIAHAVFIANAEIGGGDPCINFTSYNAAVPDRDREFCLGIDNSDSDKLKLNTRANAAFNDILTPSAGTTIWESTSAGEIIMPLQPAFNAYRNVNIANQTGAGATVVVPCDTEVFDQNSDYNNGTYTFTAPVTGRYYFCGCCHLYNVTAAMTLGIAYLNTSNNVWQCEDSNPGTSMDAGNEISLYGSALVDMDAADTCTFEIQVSNGAGNTAGIGGVATGLIRTHFSGNLEC